MSEVGGAFAVSAVVAIVRARIHGALFGEYRSNIVGKLVISQTPAKATNCGTLHVNDDEDGDVIATSP